VDPATGEPVSGDGAPRTAARGPAVSRAAATAINPNDPSTWGRVQRNAPCPCGSGKKYKHCHGAIGAETEAR
jgi:preprotein translocase subunit SecA